MFAHFELLCANHPQQIQGRGKRQPQPSPGSISPSELGGHSHPGPGTQFKVFPMTGSDLSFPPAIYPAWPEQSKQEISHFWARAQLPARAVPLNIPPTLAGDKAVASLRNPGRGDVWQRAVQADSSDKIINPSLQHNLHATQLKGAGEERQSKISQGENIPAFITEEWQVTWRIFRVTFSRGNCQGSIRQSWGFLRIGVVRTQVSKVTFPFVLF